MKAFFRNGRPNRRLAFTLTELLVAILVVAILAIVFMVSFSAVRDTANRAVCVHNLTELTVAGISYAQDHNGFFPQAYSAYYPEASSWYLGPGGAAPGQAGIVLVLPYLVAGGGSLVEKGAMSNPALFICPSTTSTWPLTLWSDGFNPASIGYGIPGSSYGYYGGFYGPAWAGWDTTFFYGSPRGLSGKSGPFLFDMICFVNGAPPVAGMEYPYSHRGIGANVAYSDGHIEWRRFPDTTYWREFDSFGFSYYLPTP